MTDRKRNPGNTVAWVGLAITCAYFLGLGSVPTKEVPTVGFVIAGVLFVLTVFIASVVGAYYAGKGKR